MVRQSDSKDVSKANGETKAGDAKKDAKPAAPVKPKEVVDEVISYWSTLAQAVSLIEPRLTARVLRTLPSVRRRLDAAKIRIIVERAYGKSNQQRETLLSLLPEASSAPAGMDVDQAPATSEKPVEKEKAKQPVPTADQLPEIDIYVTLLVLVFLLDQKLHSQGLSLADHTVQRIQTLNRRTLDGLAARIFFYYARFHELIGEPTALASIRPTLLASQRTATLRHDDETQATLLNLLMRNFFAHSLFDQADRLVAKVTFPDEASNPQLARWSYYVGRIRAIQLNYSEAHQRLQQAIRRAPEPHVAPGFLQAVHKLSIVVELLMGDIPDRAIFRQPVLRKALVPYLQVVQAVRIGDLKAFAEALDRHSEKTFRPDGTHSLILRLRHNVIKTALRTISLAYSRIPLSTVCTKLHLDSEEEAEYVVAKAIRDGVIDAVIDHDKGYMKSREVVDTYATSEPQRALNERIAFTIQLHNESVKAMRYPLAAHKKELESAAEATERERELAKGIADGSLDMDEDDGPGEGF